MSDERTCGQCLASLKIKVENFEFFSDLDAEFSFIKKHWFKLARTHHPDKGGDPATFREMNSSFQTLRDMYTQKTIDSFATSAAQTGAFDDFAGMPTASWDFYYEAEQEDVPTYRVEIAKSNRSACAAKGKAKKCCTLDEPSPKERNEQKCLIPKGSLRVGHMDKEHGSYGRWKHLNCWRVPSKVWLGLPDPDVCKDPAIFISALLQMNEILLCGVDELNEEQQQLFAKAAMKKSTWAKKTKRKTNTKTSNQSSSSSSSSSSSTSSSKSSSSSSSSSAIGTQGEHAIVNPGHHHAREKFIIPVPSKNGAGADSNSLAGKTFVLTGIFPEVGGGSGLSLGKDKVKRMITSFGGRVTGSVSGKTDILVVGKNPGASKVSKARAREKCKLVNLKELREGLVQDCLEDLGSGPPMRIQNFSAGYSGWSGRSNAITNQMSSQALAFAQGLSSGNQMLESASQGVTTGNVRLDASIAAANRQQNAIKNVKKKKTLKKVPKNKAPSKSKKKATKKKVVTKKVKKKRKATELEVKTEEQDVLMLGNLTITCDGCSKDCTSKSYFIQSAEEDYCPSCFSNITKNKKKTAILQTNGQDVVIKGSKKKKQKKQKIKI